MCRSHGARAVLLVSLAAAGCSPQRAAEDAGTTTRAEGEADETEAGASETGAEHSCGGFTLETAHVPRPLIVVVDTSMSTAETWDHDGDPLTPEQARWRSARLLLEQLFATLDEHFLIGASPFPAPTACSGPMCSAEQACAFTPTPTLSPSPDQRDAILAALPPADAGPELLGGSPALAAFEAARAELLATSEALPRQILLLTDGGFNCAEGLELPAAFETLDAELLAAVEEAFTLDGIPTTVVGVGASELTLAEFEERPLADTFAALNELALVGGQPYEQGSSEQKFHPPDELEALVETIVGPVGSKSCDIDLTMTEPGAPSPEQVPLVEVELDGQSVPHVDDCASGAGWTWIEPGLMLALCGGWCEQLYEDGAVLEVIYGCPP